MITRRLSRHLLGTAVLLSSFMILADSTSAQDASYQQDRIDISHARPANQVRQQGHRRQGQRQQVRQASQRTSMVARAAYGQTLTELPPAPLDGSLVRGSVQQTGFFDDGCNGSCGPVCDCVSCGVEGGLMGPSCGFEPSCGCGLGGDCGCSVEPSCGCGIGGDCGCGFDVGCGMEVIGGCGCGMGGGCDCGGYIEPTCGCGIGGGCDCGIETFVGPSCGMEPNCGCDACAGASCGSCGSDGLSLFLPWLRIDWNQFELFSGVNGFTGPLNFANTDANNPNNLDSAGGSFGFYQGFNHGRSLRRLLGADIAAQFGLRATQSHLSGSEATDETRHQIFLTAGLFRRVDYGLQYGLAIDYLNEDWYFQGDLTQLRGEISWNLSNCHIFGYKFAAGVSKETSTTSLLDSTGNVFQGSVEFEPLDQHRFFYRREFASGGNWEGFIGGSGDSDTILGSYVNMPLCSRAVLNTGVTYVSPNEDEGNTLANEAWNLSVGFTYRPGGGCRGGCGNYGRPMFDVADNGTFITRRR